MHRHLPTWDLISLMMPGGHRQESCHKALPLHGGYISTGKASPAERLLHSRGDGRDWAAEGGRAVSHAVKCCRRLLALCTHPQRLCLGTGCCSFLEAYSLGVSLDSPAFSTLPPPRGKEEKGTMA